MGDNSNYFSSSSLSLTHSIKYPNDIGSREESLDPPRQDASYHTAILKMAIPCDASWEEWFAFALESTKAVQGVLFNTLSRKKLLNNDRPKDPNVREPITRPDTQKISIASK